VAGARPSSTPSLDALADDPATFLTLAPPIKADLYRKAARLEADLRGYLLAHPAYEYEPAKHSAELLTIREAAALLRVSPDTLYRRWKRLPGAYKDRLDGRVKFRRASLEGYVEHLQTTAVKG
jgi:helix-turn-helix protein